MNEGINIPSYLLGKKAGGGGTPPVYEEKNVSITQNGDSTITAESGYDAISKVNLSVNVPQPSGKISITQNGTDIDVSSYASADVNVDFDISEYIGNTAGATSAKMTGGWMTLVKKLPSVTKSYANANDFSSFFRSFEGEYLPTIIQPSSRPILYFGDVCNYCSNLKKVDFSYLIFDNNITSLYGAFTNCVKLEEVDFSSLRQTGSNANCNQMFLSCIKLKKINLSNFAPQTPQCIQMFNGCSELEELDISKFDISTTTNSNQMFNNVPANCLILVKDQTAKDWFTTNWSNLTNVQIKSEYIANQGA